MFKIIDNKKIEMTNSEYTLYEEICKSFDRPNFEGKYLFKNLFEVDDQGIIIFLRAPTSSFSMEVVIFLQNLMVRQHLSKVYRDHDNALLEIKQQEKEILSLKETYNNSIAEVKSLLNDLSELPVYKELKKYREDKEKQNDRAGKNK